MLDRPIFVGGMPRSGTTLLRAMLDRHPNIACGPELRAIPALAAFTSQTRSAYADVLAGHYGLDPADYDAAGRALIESFLTPYLSAQKKKRVAEKTPANVLHFKELWRLFPDAYFIHVVRDGRDVTASLKNMPWRDPKTGKVLEMISNSAVAGLTWKQHIDAAHSAKTVIGNYFEFRYEDLVAEPEAQLRQLMRFLEEPWCDDMLHFEEGKNIFAGADEASAPQIAKPLYQSSVSRWRNDLTKDDKAALAPIISELLVLLGYEKSHAW